MLSPGWQGPILSLKEVTNYYEHKGIFAIKNTSSKLYLERIPIIYKRPYHNWFVTAIYLISIYIKSNYYSAAEPQRTRFFSGNNAIDAGAAGAALGVGAQYFANQIFNPCRRGGNRNNNKSTNNRIFGGQTLQNGALGFLAGFAGAALINNAQGNPCGR